MKNISFLLFILLFAASAKGQSSGFPSTWIGSWKGELLWYKTGQAEPQKVNMELRIQAGDSAGNFSWHIVYGKAAEDRRPYLLKAKDLTKGHWIIDELNGIVLDQYWVGQKLCGAFTVSGNTIVNNYWIEGNKLMIEFFSIPVKPIATTGKGTDESPVVESYRIGSYQKAELVRE